MKRPSPQLPVSSGARRVPAVASTIRAVGRPGIPPVDIRASQSQSGGTIILLRGCCLLVVALSASIAGPLYSQQGVSRPAVWYSIQDTRVKEPGGRHVYQSFADAPIDAMLKLRVRRGVGDSYVDQDSLRPVPLRECLNLKVTIQTFLATAADRTPPGIPVHEDGECYVETSWHLANVAGWQRLAVHITRDSSTVSNQLILESIARWPPQINVGLAGVINDIGIDSTVDDSTFNRANGRFRIQPVFGVDFPLLHSRVVRRVFVGLSFEEPLREYFASVRIQPYRLEHEAVPVHLDLGIKLERLSVTATGQACADLQDNGESCTHPDLEWRVMLLLGGALGDLLKPVLAALGL